MIIGIDHILIAVDNMDAASAAFTRLGFQVMPGGAHPNRGTFNSLVPLVDGTYLELMGINDANLAQQFPPMKRVVETLALENRLATFVLDSDDLANEVAALRARGLTITDPVAGERIRPDAQRVAWHTANFDDRALPFLIQDDTPHELRVPPPTQGIGQNARVGSVTFVSNNLNDALNQWRAILGTDLEAGLEIMLGRGAIKFERQPNQRAGLSLLQLLVPDLDARVDEMKSRGVKCDATAEGVRFGGADAAGAHLLLTKQA